MDAQTQLESLEALRRDGVLDDAAYQQARTNILRNAGIPTTEPVASPAAVTETPEPAPKRGFLDWVNENIMQTPVDWDRVWSYDWCRFRRDSHCYYPLQLDEEGTRQAGYAVWIPVDRGNCPRQEWDLQQACPVSEPGPNSGNPHARVDATVAWNEGGQRGGVPGEPSSQTPWRNP